MATYTNKLEMINTSGSTETASIYSTTGESGSPYLTTYVKTTGGWSAGYIALVSISDSRATSGRIVKSGITYAIANAGTPPYAYTTMTTAGSGTFTVPSGVTKLRVTCVGGGAGGVVTYNDIGRTFPTSAGKATTFGSVTANGAGYATFNIKVDTSGESTTYSCTSVTPGGGTTAGYTSTRTSSAYDGAPAVPLTNYQGTQILTAGNGGHADGTADYLACGSSGYKTVSTITVTPGQVISYTVGDRGAGCRYGTYTYTAGYGSSGAHVSPGGVGAILVEYGTGIQ